MRRKHRHLRRLHRARARRRGPRNEVSRHGDTSARMPRVSPGSRRPARGRPPVRGRLPTVTDQSALGSPGFELPLRGMVAKSVTATSHTCPGCAEGSRSSSGKAECLTLSRATVVLSSRVRTGSAFGETPPSRYAVRSGRRQRAGRRSGDGPPIDATRRPPVPALLSFQQGHIERSASWPRLARNPRLSPASAFASESPLGARAQWRRRARRRSRVHPTRTSCAAGPERPMRSASIDFSSRPGLSSARARRGEENRRA